jgi:outer membrane protein assembly factor BamB
MRRFLNASIVSFTFYVAMVAASFATAGDWPQFRGPNCSGRAVGDAKLPAEIGPTSHVVFRTPLPPGHSSPVVVGKYILLTAVDGQKLLTIGLDRETGRELWRAEAPHQELELVHRVGSLAQTTSASDGKIVVSFFGSCGLFAYDAATGEQLWHLPMGPFKNDFGSGNSPVIHNGKVLLLQDHDVGSFIAAYDLATGNQVWRTDRGDASRNFATPVVWKNFDREEVVAAGTLTIKGYDVQTGAENWVVEGISRQVCVTPNLGEDGQLYAAGWSAGGDPGDLIRLEPFDDFAPAFDLNKNGMLEESELPDSSVKTRFTTCDRDKDGSISRTEYERFRVLFEKSENAILAINPNLRGDDTAKNIAWREKRHVPFCASPLIASGRVYSLKDGGVLTTLNAQTGAVEKTGRVFGTDDYYASPVVGDGKVYLASEEGKLTVISAEARWKTLHTAAFEEGIYATPALVDGKIYLRTVAALYCFE